MPLSVFAHRPSGRWLFAFATIAFLPLTTSRATDDKSSTLDKSLAKAATVIATEAAGPDGPVVAVPGVIAVDGRGQEDQAPEDMRFTEFGDYLAGTFAEFLAGEHVRVRGPTDIGAVFKVQEEALSAEQL